MSRVWRDDDLRCCKSCGTLSLWCWLRYLIGRGACCDTCKVDGAGQAHGVKW